MSAKEILEEDLKIASEILEYEIGDIYGHVGVRDPAGDGILVKIFRPPDTGENQDWLVQFDYSLKKMSGIGNPPREAAIYTEIFKRRPDVKAAVHTHAPMCIALSLADKPITTVHMQSSRWGAGVPIFPKPIFILDFQEGNELAEALDQHSAVVIKGHGIVTVGKTIDEACMNALYLERTAKIQSLAHLLGFQGPTKEFFETMERTKNKLFSTAPSRRGGTSSRPLYSSEWRYYADKIKKGERWSRGWT